jgi:SPP1 family predicted phage head-tail adaptor
LEALMIISARLDQKIAIQVLTTGTDGMGSPTESYATVTGAPTWAEYLPLKGLERIEAGKVSEKEQFKLRIRRWSSLTRAHRVVYNAKNYEIIDIEDGKRDGYQVLFCREAVA